jgi:hypothetical protein
MQLASLSLRGARLRIFGFVLTLSRFRKMLVRSARK